MTDRSRCNSVHPTNKRTCDRPPPNTHAGAHEAWETPGDTRVSWATGQSPTTRQGTQGEREDWWRFRQGRLYRNNATQEWVEAVRFTRRASLFAQWCGGTVVSQTSVTIAEGTVASGSWVVVDSAGVYTIMTNAAFTAAFSRVDRPAPTRA